MNQVSNTVSNIYVQMLRKSTKPFHDLKITKFSRYKLIGWAIFRFNIRKSSLIQIFSRIIGNNLIERTNCCAPKAQVPEPQSFDEKLGITTKERIHLQTSTFQLWKFIWYNFTQTKIIFGTRWNKWVYQT